MALLVHDLSCGLVYYAYVHGGIGFLARQAVEEAIGVMGFKRVPVVPLPPQILRSFT